MRLTLRGVTALAIVALAVVLALVSGERSLNAVAAPAVGAVVYGAIQLRRAGDPAVEFGPVEPGYPGDRRELEISLEGGGVATVAADWPEGVAGESLDAVVGLPETLTAALTLTERGVHDLDGVTVTRRDALGLVESPVALGDVATAVVYPEIHRGEYRGALSALLEDEHRIERQEFDSIREYEPGDPLRRIHWASSAKRDVFMVVEYAPSRRTERVHIAADAVPGRVDEMATAVGTIALWALDAGLEVALTLPDGSVPAGSGDAHRANLLATLARASAGSLPDGAPESVDVRIESSHRTTTVRFGERLVFFDDLVSAPDGDAVEEVAAS